MRSQSIFLIFTLVGAWQPGKPTGWDNAPSSIEDFPFDGESNTYYLNPWNYTHRLGMYKTILASTPDLHFNQSSLTNPLWGLPLQFSWQHDTGRLMSGDFNIINTSSWWAGMNYYLSVIPFIGAMEAGVVGVKGRSSATITITPPLTPSPAGDDKFCVSYAQCEQQAPNATRAWKEFFLSIHPSITVDDTTHAMWNAHILSLRYATPSMQPLVSLLPSRAEADFGLDWGNLVDFIGAMRYDVDYNNTNFLQGLIIPPRILTDSDHVPFIRDFTGPQNRALAIAKAVHTAQRLSGGKLLSMFERVCCTEKGRVDAYNLCIKILESPLTTLPDIITVVGDLLKRHPGC